LPGSGHMPVRWRGSPHHASDRPHVMRAHPEPV